MPRKTLHASTLLCDVPPPSSDRVGSVRLAADELATAAKPGFCAACCMKLTFCMCDDLCPETLAALAA
jgi:hypothetical protein